MNQTVLWQASEEQKNNSEMAKLMRFATEKTGQVFTSYQDFHQFSTNSADKFWSLLIDFYDVIYQGDLKPVNTDKGFESYGWFSNVKLNFAENLLAKGDADSPALIGTDESGEDTPISYGRLRKQVAQFQSLIQPQFGKDDVLACYMPNCIETVVAMLACTASGGVFTSSSSDFGKEGVIDRFSQSEPRVLVAAQGYFYGGKYFDCMSKIAEIVAVVPSIEKVFIVAAEQGDAAAINSIEKAEWWPEFDDSDRQPHFEMRAFADPLYIMYSSGTTGKPKCIVHSVGGTLLKHISELGPHSDLNQDKTIMFFTTCGWMMWNWLVSSLFFGARVVLYDGSPNYPSFHDYLSIVDRLKVNLFGTSPKFLRAMENAEVDVSELSLESLQCVLSTGSPLLPEQYDYVYTAIKSDVHLASISGGTDILGCFFCGNPLLPVVRGELQGKALGMDAVCVDENGHELIDQEGELVCRQSFPSRPIYFLNDENGEKIKSAYFNEFDGWWHHGDFIKVSEHGGAQFMGRSDSTLNPGGVRIGTSEIYRQTETLGYIDDSVCVGKQVDGDVEVWLFVKLVEGRQLDEEMTAQIKKQIRQNTTPRHVPAKIIAVDYIPYTRSGKKIEGVVSNILNGRKVTNLEAIVEPEGLSEYQQYQ